jgi:hypothetical protein
MNGPRSVIPDLQPCPGEAGDERVRPGTAWPRRRVPWSAEARLQLYKAAAWLPQSKAGRAARYQEPPLRQGTSADD